MTTKVCNGCGRGNELFIVVERYILRQVSAITEDDTGLVDYSEAVDNPDLIDQQSIVGWRCGYCGHGNEDYSSDRKWWSGLAEEVVDA